MKSVHVPFGFFPDPVGGTEVYVAALATELMRAGHAVVIVAPGLRSEHYRHGPLAVQRFAVSSEIGDISELYDEGDAGAARRFGEVLDRERPDIVHLHAFTRSCSVRLVREAKARGIPVVFTYHTPTVSCSRGTLLEHGVEPCDGRIEASRCAGCTLEGLGVRSFASRTLGLTPIAIGNLLESVRLRGGAWTALRMTSLIEQRRRAILELFSLVDGIVSLAPWVRDVLRANGVPDDKICSSPHGIPQAASGRRSGTATRGRLRVAHLGRVDPVKGTAILIRALRQIPDAPLDVDIFGIVQSVTSAAVKTELQRLAEGDGRIKFHDAIEHSAVVGTLAKYDLVAVPSQWLETGPLIVLEAFAAGVPILGSALGGIQDKVTDGFDGLLVRPYDSVDSWATTLQRCAADPALIERLHRGVQPPRSTGEVAAEMDALYRRVVLGAHGRQSAEVPLPVGAPGDSFL